MVIGTQGKGMSQADVPFSEYSLWDRQIKSRRIYGKLVSGTWSFL